MAPKKGAKRAQSAQDAKANAQPEKKARNDAKPKIAPKFKPVVEGIQQAGDLSESCREMLLAMIPGSLGTLADERHETQEVCVKLLGEALEHVAGLLQRSVEEENAKLESVERSSIEMAAKVEAAEEAVVVADTEEKKKSEALIDAVRALEIAEEDLQKQQAAQHSLDGALSEAESHKAILAQAMEMVLKLIVAGELDPATADAHYNALQPAVQLLNLEASLITALPTACVRPKDQRGMFDNMVMEQLQKSFTTKVEELERVLHEGADSKNERAQTVQVSATNVESARAFKQSVAAELIDIQAALNKARDHAKAAKADFAACEPQRLEIVEARDANIAQLESFKQYNVSTFELLRDAMSKPVAAPPAEQPIAQNIVEEASVEGPHAPVAQTVVAETPAADGAMNSSEEKDVPEAPPTNADAVMQDCKAEAPIAESSAAEKELTETPPTKAEIAMQENRVEAPVAVGGA